MLGLADEVCAAAEARDSRQRGHLQVRSGGCAEGRRTANVNL